MIRQFISLSFALLTASAFSQNTGGVFGPIVNEGHSSVQYRGTFDLGNDGFAQRIHYQQAVNDDFMWRTVFATRKTDSSDVDFDFVQLELFWELSDNDDNWRRGLRFDLQLRDGDRPSLLGVNWMNQYNFNHDWSARFLTLTSIDFGENPRNGLFLQTRASVTRRINDIASLGVELHNVYGAVDEIRGLSDQAHQIGPVATFALNEDFSIYSGILFGLSQERRAPQLRLWLTKAF